MIGLKKKTKYVLSKLPYIRNLIKEIEKQPEISRDRDSPDAELVRKYETLRTKPWSIEWDDSADQLDIVMAFRILFGRYPSEWEYPAHLSFAGGSLDSIVSMYMESTEFRNRKLSKPNLASIKWIDYGKFGLYVSLDDLAVGKSIADTLNYEPNVLPAFKSILKPDHNVIDIGANIGIFSLTACAQCINGKVFAFEPNVANCSFILASSSRNHFGNLYLYAVGASDKDEILILNSNFSTGATSRIPQHPEEILNSKLVQTIRLDSHPVSKERIDVIKIDIDGGEGKALRGAENTIKTNKPVIFFEFSPPLLLSHSNLGAVEFLDFLKNLGYKFRYVGHDGQVDCSDSIERVINYYEMAKSTHIDLVAYQ
jgi:FkbM family methyltransferase